MRSPRSRARSERVARTRAARRTERGSAVVDFALVGGLVVVVALAMVQLALGLHVRNVLTDAAGEGARRAALSGGTADEASARVHALTDAALSDGYVESVQVGTAEVDGMQVIEVRVTAPLPVLGLLGPGGSLEVTGHAVSEEWLAGPGGDRGADPQEAGP